MELSDLRIFRAVVEQGGITRAAEHLGRVQSNVTKRIRQLEADLGQPLFVREGRRLILAPAGTRLLDYAVRLLALAEEARLAVAAETPRGPFRIGAMESTAAVRLPPYLTAFAETYPDVTLELTTGNPSQLATALTLGEIEAAFVAEPVADRRFESAVAFREEPVIVTAGNAPDVDAPGGTPATMIVFEEGCPHRRRLEDWYQRRGELPNRTVELRSYHAMLGCVVAGMGAALLPKSVLSTFPDAHRLRQHALPPDHDEIKTLLVWRRGFASSNIDALVDLLSSGTPDAH